MTRSTIFHALGLRLHPAPGSLRLPNDVDPWEAQRIVRYERPVRSAGQHRDAAPCGEWPGPGSGRASAR